MVAPEPKEMVVREIPSETAIVKKMPIVQQLRSIDRDRALLATKYAEMPEIVSDGPDNIVVTIDEDRLSAYGYTGWGDAADRELCRIA
jgi:hypothetical protein